MKRIDFPQTNCNTLFDQNTTPALFGHKFLLMGVLLGFWLGITGATAKCSEPAAALGWSDSKPDAGPFVEVDGKFMVPYTETIPGTDVEFEMIPVPGGEFKFGSPESEEGRNDDEGPQIDVITDPMWVAKTEVTWSQYKEYMNLYSIFKEFEAKKKRPVGDSRIDAITAPTELYDPSFTYEYGQEMEQPAVTMTQYSAQQFTKWMSRVTDRQYRLPTEAEWEYAARGGTTSAYSFGDSADDLGEYAWFFDNAEEGQVDVGTKEANPYGLHDMHGNVAEWTVSQYTENGYEAFAGKEGAINATDVVVWPETHDSCVLRGGSWEMDPEQLRSAARMVSDNEAWKEEDPNFPKSPWWFTSDPARGVGFRLFRSAKALPTETISKFWEPGPEDLKDDIQMRLDEGRGGLGKVDPDLPAAIKGIGR